MEYVRHTKAFDELYSMLNKYIKDGLFKDREVVMFGTSNIASIIIHYLRINDIETAAIVDNDRSREGQLVYGVKVYHPEGYLKEYRDRAVILIASTYQNEMLNQLEEMGYREGEQVYKCLDLPKVLNDYSFVDRSGYTELTEEQVKRSQLGILKKLHEVCTQNNLRYYLCGGTLLGAIRHKGYIPWDDDVDVAMPLGDMVKLAGILREDKDYSFISFADDIEYFDTCALMVDNNTICDFNSFMQLTSGVSIDVFPFSGVPAEDDGLEEYLTTMRNLDMDKWNKMYDAEKCKEALTKQMEYMASFDFDEYDTVGDVLTRFFVKDVFPREYFDETVSVEFEGLQLIAPKGWHDYLSRLYGDYMTLPPKEKQTGVHYFRAYKK